MSCHGRIRRAFSTHRGRPSGADIYDGPIAVAGSNGVVSPVIGGAVFDDQIAGGIYINTAAVGDNVVSFDPIIAAGGMNSRGTKSTVIFPDEAIGVNSYCVAPVELGGAVVN